MKKLSVGNMDSTLENWLKLSTAMFGATSEATKWLQAKADEQGLQEEVIADESQTIILLTQLHLGVEEPGDADESITGNDG